MSPSTESRHTSATVTAASIAVLVAVTALAVTAWWRDGATVETALDPAEPTSAEPTSAGATSAGAGPRLDRAVDVLRAWDRARAAAWADGDAEALADLYTPGSQAGEQDAAMLRRWTERGLRVRGMRMQVLRVDVREQSDRRLVLRVTDRLTGAVAVRESDETTWRLPADRADTRRLAFRRTAGRWRLASSYDRPLARIAATSGSSIS